MKTYKSNLAKIELKYTKSDFNKIKITNSKDSYNYIRQFYHDDINIYESFFILLLNKSNNTIGYAKISQGGVAGTYVDTLIVAKYCVDSLASSVILAHNHPSGNIIPSDCDKNITDKIKKCLDLFNCKVLDHIILSDENYYSFADEYIL